MVSGKWRVVSILLFFLSSFSAAAGQIWTGTVEGTVKGSGGGGVQAAQVKIFGLDGGFVRNVDTNGDGRFFSMQVPPGRYRVTVNAYGYQEAASEVVVRLGRISTADVQLRAATTGTDGEPLRRGATYSRGVRPAQTASNGDESSGSGNTVIIDGLETPPSREGRAKSIRNITNSVFNEVLIQTNGFDAKYFGSTIATNVVTRGGTSAFRGSFGVSLQTDRLDTDTRPILRGMTERLGYIRPDRTNSGTYLEPPDDQFTNLYPTANFGGPIISRRLWFFVASGPQYFDRARTSVFPNGMRETNVVKQSNDFYFARIDGQITNNLRAKATYTYSPETTRGGILSFVTTSSIGDQTGRGGRVNSSRVTYGVNYTPLSNLAILIGGGRNYLNERDGSYGVPKGLRVRCSGSQVVLSTLSDFGCGPSNLVGFDSLGNTSRTTKDVTTRNTFYADAQLLANEFHGRHVLSFGYQLDKLKNDIDSGFFESGELTFYFGQNAFGIGSPIGVAQLTQFRTVGNASSRNQGLYIHDNWSRLGRLNLGLGVRIEAEAVPSFATADVPVTFDWSDKVAPRISGSFNIMRDGRSRVYASYGRFYERFKYELLRASFGGDRFSRTFIPIHATDDVNRFASVQSIHDEAIKRGGIVLDLRVPSVELYDARVEPGLIAQRQSQFTFGLEQDLDALGGFFRKSILRIGYMHKQIDKAIEDISVIGSSGDEAVHIINPGRTVRLTRSASGIPATPEAERKYDALEVSLEKRLSHNYFIRGRYIFSRLSGNYPAPTSAEERGQLNPDFNRILDLPFQGFDINGMRDNGRLPSDRPHSVGIVGGYTLNWLNSGANQTDLVASLTGASGTPVSTQVSFFNVNTFVFGRNDLGRTDTFTQTDLAITHRYRFGNDRSKIVAFDVSISNVFDEANVTGVQSIIAIGSLAGRERGFDLFNNCTGDVCDELNTIRAIFDGGIRDQLLSFINGQVQIGTDTTGQPVYETIRRDARYGHPSTFQPGRRIRLGIRFSF